MSFILLVPHFFKLKARSSDALLKSLSLELCKIDSLILHMQVNVGEFEFSALFLKDEE